MKITEYICNHCNISSVSKPGDIEEFIEVNFPRAHIKMPVNSTEEDLQRNSILHFCSQICVRNWFDDRIKSEPQIE